MCNLQYNEYFFPIKPGNEFTTALASGFPVIIGCFDRHIGSIAPKAESKTGTIAKVFTCKRGIDVSSLPFYF